MADTVRGFVERYLAQMRANRTSVLADLNAVDGAIQVCELMLAELDQVEAPKTSTRRTPTPKKKGGA